MTDWPLLTYIYKQDLDLKPDTCSFTVNMYAYIFFSMLMNHELVCPHLLSVSLLFSTAQLSKDFHPLVASL